MTKNIFVVGLDDFNRRPLERVRHADQYKFHRLLDYATATQPSSIDFEHLLAKAQAELRTFSGSVDAIVGFWDFPTTLMLPFLRSEYQLPGPSVEGVLRCEHKYWAREIQNRIEPDAVPRYAAINPFDEKQASTPPLNFPFWMKPVKAHSSQLGFRIESQNDYEEAIRKTREKIEYFAANLNQIMKRAEVPASIAEIDGWHSIAEEIISDGRQCTLEGYVFEGEVVIYGVVDSLRGPNQSSLERYQYPSDVPQPVKDRMVDVSSRVIQATQLDNSPFNIEFYWYPDSDRIWILEINARISKSHSLVFEKVEGIPHNEVMIDIALGKRPEYPLKHGNFPYAAKFMWRRYDCDGHERVLHVPSEQKLHQLEEQFPGSEIHVLVEDGMQLSELHHQDSYSFELAEVFVGGRDHEELEDKYEHILSELDVEVSSPAS